MSISEQIDLLLQEAKCLESIARSFQPEFETDPASADVSEESFRQRYLAWVTKALDALPEDLRSDFQAEYSNGSTQAGLRQFIKSPSELNDVPPYIGDGEFIRCSAWQYPVEETFMPAIREQQLLLEEALARESTTTLNKIEAEDFSRLQFLIAEACKVFYTIAEIDLLFVTCGGQKHWWQEPKETVTSARINQVTGWFEGISASAPHHLGSITEAVAKYIYQAPNVTDDHRTRIEHLLEQPMEEVRATSPLDRLNLHPKVIKACRKLFEDGHYRQAILQTYLALVEAVKEKANRLDLDNTALMQHVFSPKSPKLRYSDDPDECQGIMWLFSGATMAVRNPRAHRSSGEDDDDIDQAIEWLVFASALFRILDKCLLIQESS